MTRQHGKWLKYLATAGIALVFGLATTTAQAGKKDDTLVWATEFEPPTFNYYDQTLREGTILSRLVWDSLYFTDPVTGENKPHLATKLTWVDSKTIDVDLRQDVVFHNGDKMTADDLVFTITMVNDPANKMANSSDVQWIASAEKLGEYKVRLHLKDIYAPAIEMLSTSVVVYPKAYYEKVGKDGYALAPVGTGPYKVTEVTPGKRLVMTRNENYFGGVKGKAKIGTVVMRFIPERNTQIAELLAGHADLIWRLPMDAGQKLEGRRGIKVVVGDTMRVGYLQFDSAGRSGKSPVNDVRVRQAISYAIDRESIVKNLLGGGQVVNLACYPNQFGCEAPGAPIYKYDPEKAKALLAEAGYKDGVSVDFYGYRDRPIAEAMMGYMSKVGIKANLQWMQYSALRDKVREGKVPMDFMTWGSGSVRDVANITSYFFESSGDDTARDPEIEKLLRAGDGTIDEAERKKNYSAALTLIAERAHWLPLWSYAYYYAMNKDLEFTPTPDEILHLYRAHWN
jgi:peptide/nickel transport system substrate-binding protein